MNGGQLLETHEINCADETSEIGDESMSARSSATDVKVTVPLSNTTNTVNRALLDLPDDAAA
jgi:hypothetical protein